MQHTVGLVLLVIMWQLIYLLSVRCMGNKVKCSLDLNPLSYD